MNLTKKKQGEGPTEGRLETAWTPRVTEIVGRAQQGPGETGRGSRDEQWGLGRGGHRSGSRGGAGGDAAGRVPWCLWDGGAHLAVSVCVRVHVRAL